MFLSTVLAIAAASSTQGAYASSRMAITPAIEACRAVVVDDASEESLAGRLHFYLSPVTPKADLKFDEIAGNFFNDTQSVRFMTPDPKPPGRPVYMTISAAKDKCLVRAASGSKDLFDTIIETQIRSAENVTELPAVVMPKVTARRFIAKRKSISVGYRAVWIPAENLIAVGTERLKP